MSLDLNGIPISRLDDIVQQKNFTKMQIKDADRKCHTSRYEKRLSLVEINPTDRSIMLVESIN